MAQEVVASSDETHADASSRLATVTSLLEALLIGLSSLTQTDLRTACVDVLQMAACPMAASTLADELRWVISSMHANVLSKPESCPQYNLLTKIHKLSKLTGLLQHLIITVHMQCT